MESVVSIVYLFFESAVYLIFCWLKRYGVVSNSITSLRSWGVGFVFIEEGEGVECIDDEWLLFLRKALFL